jgi:hypothetical protein
MPEHASMIADDPGLYEFEMGLNPQNLQDSAIPATIIGYGEISAIFQIANFSQVVYKRLPLFSDRISAEKYAGLVQDYCDLLCESGLCLPEYQTFIIEPPNRPVAVYIAQKRLALDRFGHQLIHTFEPGDMHSLIESIIIEISKVWHFNHVHRPALELALDGQLSNWVLLEGQNKLSVHYIDTSTPMFRKEGVEQLDPELFLKSAPGFLRWILRLAFLKDILNRYYDQRLVFIDLAANLFKEQRPDLIPVTIGIMNRQLASDQKPLTVTEVKRYYREDKLIWGLYLAFRRIDRWLTSKVFRKRYEFILPGKIKR